MSNRFKKKVAVITGAAQGIGKRVAEKMAKEKGMKVGIVSSVSLDHATPGAFYAHQPTRKNY